MRWFPLRLSICSLILSGLAGSGLSVNAQPLALRGGTVHPISGPPIADAVVLVDGGEIQEIGSGLEIPEGSKIIDFTGKHLYPGFVHPASVLGLVEINSVAGTRDYDETGDNNAALRAEVAWNADSRLLPVTAAGGVLTAHVIPRGGAFAGTSAVMKLDGWNWEDMTVASPVGLHLNFPPMLSGDGESEEEAEEARKKILRGIDDTLANARAYLKARNAAGAPKIEEDPKLEALGPLLDGDMPLWLHAREKTQIEAALDWAAENELHHLVLVTGTDARYLAERLASENIPVVLNGVLRLPERTWEPYDTAYTTAAVLHEAGVDFCIGDGGSAFGAFNSRNLPFHAAMAAAFGLPKDVALESITLRAAKILGVDNRLGSLEPGKDATFMLTDGDPLEILTTIERVWISGQELDPSLNPQQQLFEKYRQRPRPGGAPASRFE